MFINAYIFKLRKPEAEGKENRILSCLAGRRIAAVTDNSGKVKRRILKALSGGQRDFLSE
jgi:hypothetical protein